MANFSVLYRRFKKLVFFLIIFFLVRSYYLRKKRGGSDGKRIGGIPERKRITDGSEQQKSDEKSKISVKEDDESDDESELKSESKDEEGKIKENHEEVPISLETTETAVGEESKKDENDNLENEISLSVTENIKGSKDVNSVDIEKTEIVNEIIKENEIEAQSREVPVVNNIEIIPTIADEIKFQILDQNNKIAEMNEEVKEIPENDQFKSNVDETVENEKVIEEVILEQKSGLNENSLDSEVKDLHQETLVNIVENENENENVIEAPEKDLIDFGGNIIIPTKNTNEIITDASPEKVEEKVDASASNSTEILEESTSIIDGDISEEIIEPPVEEVLEEIVETQSGVAEELIETIEDYKSKEVPTVIPSVPTTTNVEVMDKPIVEQIVETALETIVSKEEISIPEAVIEATQPEVVVEQEVNEVTQPEAVESKIIEAAPETVVELQVVEPEVVETALETVAEPQVVEQEIAQPEVVETVPETLVEQEIAQPEVVETVPETVVEQEVAQPEVVETVPETVVEQEIAQPEVVETVPETVVEQEVAQPEVVETAPETVVEQEVVKPEVVEPQVVQQEVAQPEVVETVPETVVEPQVVEQEVAQPEVVETVPETVVEPQVVEQEVAQPEVVETAPETVVEQEVAKPEVVETVPETVIEPQVVEQEVIAEPEVTKAAQPESIIEPEVIEVVSEATKPEIIDNVEEEIIEQQATEFTGDISEPQITEEIIEVPDINEEKSFAFQEPQNIDNLINEIEKVVNDSDSDNSIVEEKEKEKEEVIKPKPINSKDIVGHEEIIYEDNGDGNGDDDGEWIDEDDDGEWIDEDDDDGEWIDEEEEEEVKEVNPEVNKRQSLLINTDLTKRQSLLLNTDLTKRQSLLLNTPLDRKRQSLLLNTPIPREVLNSLMTPMSTNSSSFPLPTPAPVENKPKVLPDDILERIFREVDPQTMWVLRNTSIKTRNIVDNILKETFEQFDLSMDPLYFDVTSKDNLGLVLNSLELSPFALAMLLHEILKLDSQHIGYAFGQMFRVPSKIDFDYLTDLIVDTLNILRSKKGVDIADVMLGLQHYYCFNHSELEFYQLFDLIEMTPEEVARFIQNHYHFILSKSLPPLLQALDVDEVFVADMCKAYANDDMDAFARIISKVPVRFVRTSVHPNDVQGDRVVVVNENGEDVIVVLNDDDKHGRGKAPANVDVNDDDEEWEEEDDDENGKNIEEEDVEEEEEDDDEIDIENVGGRNRDSMIIVENNQSFSLFVGRILRFLNMTTKDVASFFKYLPEYCSYDEDEILEGLNWNEEQINEMRQIMKEEQDKIARKMRELSKLIIQRRMSISSGIGSPLSGSPSVSHPSNRQFY